MASSSSDVPLPTRFLSGFIEVPIRMLDFESRGNFSREIDDKITERLGQLFREAFQPNVPENHVSGIVGEGALATILAELEISREELKKTLYSGRYPLVQSTRIWCPADRHRVQAATQLFGQDTTWFVQLHCVPDGVPNDVYDDLVCFLSERFFPSFPLSDGEVYRNVRRCEGLGTTRRWLSRLSPSKRISLSMLLGSDKPGREAKPSGSMAEIRFSFDRLLVFPGLWEGLELGNLHKHLALHCEAEIIRYLSHVYDTWTVITGGIAAIQRSVDIPTARSLQSLAPTASLSDRNLTAALLEERRVFAGIEDPVVRKQLAERLLNLGTVIPSIKSLHENMKLFSIAAKVLRSYLLTDRTRGSLQVLLRHQWKPPAHLLVEHSEGRFYEFALPPSFELAYQQLFLAAIRNFPGLTAEAPKVDSGDRIPASVCPSTVSMFYSRAALLGFLVPPTGRSTPARRAEQGPLNCAGPVEVEVPSLDRRWGRPFVKTFRQIQKVSFLPHFQPCQAQTQFPTVLYLQRDFVHAFLGSSSYPEAPVLRTITIGGARPSVLEAIDEEPDSRLANSPAEDVVMENTPQYLQTPHEAAPIQEDIIMQDVPAPGVAMADPSINHVDRIGGWEAGGDTRSTWTPLGSPIRDPATLPSVMAPGAPQYRAEATDVHSRSDQASGWTPRGRTSPQIPDRAVDFAYLPHGLSSQNSSRSGVNPQMVCDPSVLPTLHNGEVSQEPNQSRTLWNRQPGLPQYPLPSTGVWREETSSMLGRRSLQVPMQNITANGRPFFENARLSFQDSFGQPAYVPADYASQSTERSRVIPGMIWMQRVPSDAEGPPVPSWPKEADSDRSRVVTQSEVQNLILETPTGMHSQLNEQQGHGDSVSNWLQSASFMMPAPGMPSDIPLSPNTSAGTHSIIRPELLPQTTFHSASASFDWNTANSVLPRDTGLLPSVASSGTDTVGARPRRPTESSFPGSLDDYWRI